MANRAVTLILGEFKKSIQESTNLFLHLLDGPSVISTASPQAGNSADIEQKILYMAVALMCSQWEGLRFRLEDAGVSKAQCGAIFRIPLIQIIEIKDLRNCVMHYYGNANSYNAQYTNPGDRQIDSKFININGTLTFKEADIKGFFGVFENDAIVSIFSIV